MRRQQGEDDKPTSSDIIELFIGLTGHSFVPRNGGFYH